MEVKIGIQNVSREIVLETDDSAEQVGTAIDEAIKGSALVLDDNKGRRVIVPSAALAYVELGTEEKRRVGFGG